VKDEFVRFLNARRRIAPDQQFDLGPAFGGSAVATEQGYGY
jgi:sucrose-6-phosphate hydrolase SacC (GH32 family)